MRTCSLWTYLPITYSILTAVGLVVVYVIAIVDEKITPLSGGSSQDGPRSPPYISIAGNTPPASCVFSQVMNFAAFVGLIIGFLRYLQLKPKVQRPWLNIGSLVTFSLACFGMTLVGNFQLSNDEEIHNVGTTMTFGLGTVFCWLQSVTTLRVNLKKEGRRVGVLRFLLSGTITTCMVLYFTLMAHGLHIHAARTQWALVMFFLGFISTFALEFRHHHFEITCRDYPEAPLGVSETFSEVSEHQPDQM